MSLCINPGAILKQRILIGEHRSPQLSKLDSPSTSPWFFPCPACQPCMCHRAIGSLTPCTQLYKWISTNMLRHAVTWGINVGWLELQRRETGHGRRRGRNCEWWTMRSYTGAARDTSSKDCNNENTGTKMDEIDVQSTSVHKSLKGQVLFKAIH